MGSGAHRRWQLTLGGLYGRDYHYGARQGSPLPLDDAGAAHWHGPLPPDVGPGQAARRGGFTTDLRAFLSDPRRPVARAARRRGGDHPRGAAWSGVPAAAGRLDRAGGQRRVYARELAHDRRPVGAARPGTGRDASLPRLDRDHGRLDRARGERGGRPPPPSYTLIALAYASWTACSGSPSVASTHTTAPSCQNTS